MCFNGTFGTYNSKEPMVYVLKKPMDKKNNIFRCVASIVVHAVRNWAIETDILRLRIDIEIEIED